MEDRTDLKALQAELDSYKVAFIRRFTTLFDDPFQRFSTIFNDFQRFSTIFNGFPRFVLKNVCAVWCGVSSGAARCGGAPSDGTGDTTKAN